MRRSLGSPAIIRAGRPPQPATSSADAPAHTAVRRVITGAQATRACRLALPRMEISQAQFDDVIAHAQADAPNECCGFMKLSDGSVADVFRAENIRHSPYGYDFGFKDLQRANELDDEGFGVAV